MSATRVGFVGMRCGDPATYEQTVRMYRDVLRLSMTSIDGDRSTRFALDDGSPLHVYGPGDAEHRSFGDRMCVGLVVDDVVATRTALAAVGLEILDDPMQRDGVDAWFHYRAPDGSIQEIMGPDRLDQPRAIRRPGR